VGGDRTIKVDVRVIAATNRDLEAEVAAADFREDLYYRLNVMPIQMPPLRERTEDIPDLARFLVGKIARRQGRELAITDSAVRLLMRHPWPGNVRELENCLERAAVMSETGTIDRDAVNIAGVEDRMPAEALLDFLEYLGSSPLVAFHVTFDETMVRRAMREHLGLGFRHAWLDLAYVMPALLPGYARRYRSLDDWSRHFGITNYARHSALADALATAQLLLAALALARARNCDSYRSLRDLERAQRWVSWGN
jgi:hypothetical protein